MCGIIVKHAADYTNRIKTSGIDNNRTCAQLLFKSQQNMSQQCVRKTINTTGITLFSYTDKWLVNGNMTLDFTHLPCSSPV